MPSLFLYMIPPIVIYILGIPRAKTDGISRIYLLIVLLRCRHLSDGKSDGTISVEKLSKL